MPLWRAFVGCERYIRNGPATSTPGGATGTWCTRCGACAAKNMIRTFEIAPFCICSMQPAHEICRRSTDRESRPPFRATPDIREEISRPANLLYRDALAAPYFGLRQLDASALASCRDPLASRTRCPSAAAPELAEGSIQAILCRRAGAGVRRVIRQIPVRLAPKRSSSSNVRPVVRLSGIEPVDAGREINVSH